LHAVEAANTKWWLQPTAALLIAGLLMMQWLVAGLDPNKQPPPIWVALPIAIAGGLAFAYGIPWLLSLFPAYITVFADRICRTVGSTGRAWKWVEISVYGWRDCGEYDLLILEHCQETQVLIGVPPEVPRSELERFLDGCGLEKTPPEPTNGLENQ